MSSLEIGPGPEKLGEDWATVSAAPGPAVDVLAEWGLDTLPFQSEEFDEVYASHVIEHVGWMNAQRALAEAWRVLKHGGTIELHTIDFAVVAQQYSRGVATDPERFKHFMEEISYRVFAYPIRTGDRACVQWHHSCYDRAYLEHVLTTCGFHGFEQVEEPRGPEKHGAYNLGIKAVKL